MSRTKTRPTRPARRPHADAPLVTDAEWALLLMQLEDRIVDDAASARVRHPVRARSRAW